VALTSELFRVFGVECSANSRLVVMLKLKRLNGLLWQLLLIRHHKRYHELQPRLMIDLRRLKHLSSVPAIRGTWVTTLCTVVCISSIDFLTLQFDSVW